MMASNMLTVVGLHLIRALHGADLGGHYRAAAVGVARADVDQRLLADNTGAAYFLDLAVTVGDDPVARQQLGRHLRRCFSP